MPTYFSLKYIYFIAFVFSEFRLSRILRLTRKGKSDGPDDSVFFKSIHLVYFCIVDLFAGRIHDLYIIAFTYLQIKNRQGIGHLDIARHQSDSRYMNYALLFDAAASL